MNRTIKRLQSDLQIKTKHNDKFISFINRYRSNSRTRKSGKIEGSVGTNKSLEKRNSKNRKKTLREIMMSNSSSYEDSATEYIAESAEEGDKIRHHDVLSLMNIIGPNPQNFNRSRDSNIDTSKTMNKSIKKLHSSNNYFNKKKTHKRGGKRKSSASLSNSHSRKSRSNSNNSINKKQKKVRKMHSENIPTYLKDTVSSRNKDSKINKLENIFFDKENKEKPLTESELMDSKLKLNNHNLSRRSSGGRGTIDNIINNEVIDSAFYKIPQRTYTNLHSKNNVNHQINNNLDNSSKIIQMCRYDPSKSQDDFTELFNKPVREELEKIYPNDKSKIKHFNESELYERSRINDTAYILTHEKSLRESDGKHSAYKHRSRSLKVEKIELEQSQMSNSLERAEVKSILKNEPNIDSKKPRFGNECSSCKCRSEKMSTKYAKTSAKPDIIRENLRTQELMFFAARQKLLEKIEKSLDQQNTIQSIVKIERQTSKNKIMKMYQENRPSNFSRIGNYENYCKIMNLNAINDKQKVIRKNAMKNETKKLAKKIPQSILANFHIPNYLRG